MTDVTRPRRVYTFSVAGWMVLYLVLLFGVVIAERQGLLPPGPIRYALALAPAVPVIGIIFAVGRLMRDSDEYVRALMAHRIVVASGVTFALTTAWGFLEALADAPHIELYWVFVLFWMVWPFTCFLIRRVR
jgi:hypothetical protein